MRPRNRILATTKFGPSLTLPDQSYTVKQLFDRFRKGLPTQAQQREGTFADDSNEVDLEKVVNMSRMDKADLAAEIESQTKATVEQLERDKEARDEELKAIQVAEKDANDKKPGAAPAPAA